MGLAVVSLLGHIATLALLLTGRNEVDVVNNHLEFAAALPVALPGVVSELPLNNDAGALAQRARQIVGTIAKQHAVHKVGVILPLLRLRVAATVVYGHAKGKNVHATLRRTNLGVACKISRNNNFVDAHDISCLFAGCIPSSCYSSSWRLTTM